MKKRLLQLFLFSFLILTCTKALASDIFWVQDGKLKLEIKRAYVYLYNELGGSKYYYELKDDIYTPRASKISENVLRFKIKGMIPENVEITNYENQKKNNIKELVFYAKGIYWKVKKENHRYYIQTVPKNEIDISESSSASDVKPVTKDITHTKRTKSAKLSFEKKYVKKVEEMKPNFQINLSDKMNLILKISKLSQIERTGLKENEKKKIEESIKEKINKLSVFIQSKIKPEIEKNAQITSITAINAIDYESFNVLNDLYDSFLEMDNRKQQFNLEKYQEKYTTLLDLLEQLREFKSELQSIKNNIISSKNKITLLKRSIKNLEDSIREKDKVKIAQKSIYQSNIEAHAEYGLYVYRFQFKGGKTFLKHDEEIGKLLRVEAINDLSKIVINNETILEYKGQKGGLHLKDWIEEIRSGFISINPTKDDVIPFSSKGIKYFFVIKYVKYLPRTEDSFELEEKNLDEQESLKENYTFYSVLNRAELNDFISEIEKDNSIREKKNIIDLIKKKYEKMEGDREDVAGIRKEMFIRFITQINEINSGIKKHESDKTKITNNINSEESEIKRLYECARQIYGESSIDNKERPDCITNKDNVKTTCGNAKMCITELYNTADSLIKMLNESFNFYLNDFGNAFFQLNQKSHEYLSQLICDTFFSLDSRYQLISETIKTTVENGIFVERTEKTLKLAKEYKTMSVFLDDNSVINNTFIAYVILRLDTEVKPAETLKRKQFDSLKRSLYNVWNDIKNELELRPEPIPRPEPVPEPEPVPVPVPEKVLCKNCYEIDGKIFSLKYLNDTEKYEKIEYNEAAPETIVKTVKDMGKKWELPSSKDVLALVKHIKSGKGFTWDIRNKKIYISGKSWKTRFPVLHIKNNYSYEEKVIDSGDIAFFVFVTQ